MQREPRQRAGKRNQTHKGGEMNNYNINDVLSVGNPLDDGKGFECIKCNQAGEMSFSPYPVNDWGCGHCGEWQQEGEK
jgi:hypothetical protein